jgi:hypothetical protein
VPNSIAEQKKNTYAESPKGSEWLRTLVIVFGEALSQDAPNFRGATAHQKRNKQTGEFMEVNSGGDPFKGVANEPDGRDTLNA